MIYTQITPVTLVQNRPDDRVLVIAEGKRNDLEKFGG